MTVYIGDFHAVSHYFSCFPFEPKSCESFSEKSIIVEQCLGDIYEIKFEVL